MTPSLLSRLILAQCGFFSPEDVRRVASKYDQRSSAERDAAYQSVEKAWREFSTSEGGNE